MTGNAWDGRSQGRAVVAVYIPKTDDETARLGLGRGSLVTVFQAPAIQTVCPLRSSKPCPRTTSESDQGDRAVDQRLASCR